MGKSRLLHREQVAICMEGCSKMETLLSKKGDDRKGGNVQEREDCPRPVARTRFYFQPPAAQGAE